MLSRTYITIITREPRIQSPEVVFFTFDTEQEHLDGVNAILEEHKRNDNNLAVFMDLEFDHGEDFDIKELAWTRYPKA